LKRGYLTLHKSRVVYSVEMVEGSHTTIMRSSSLIFCNEQGGFFAVGASGGPSLQSVVEVPITGDLPWGGAREVAEKGARWASSHRKVRQGLKPGVDIKALAARLKPCPDTS